MTTEATFEELLAGLRTDITSIAEDKLSKGEFTERMDKVVKDLETLMKDREKDADRRVNDLPQCDPNRDLARKLVSLGVTSLVPSKDAEGFRPPILDAYRTDPVTGQTDPTPVIDADIRAALDLCDQVYIADRMMEACGPKRGRWDIEKAMSNDGGRELFLKHFPDLGGRYDRLTQALAEVQGMKANLTTTTATDWVPTGYTSNLLEILRVATPELNLIPSFPQPTATFDYPLLTGSGVGYDRAEGSAPPQGEFSTGKRTFTAKEPAILMKFTGIVEEDSIVAIAPTVRSESVRALAEGLSMLITNGDTGASSAHIDNDLRGSGNAELYYAFDGLRQYALDIGTDSSVAGTAGPLTTALVADAIAAMKKYGMNKTDLALLIHPVGLAHLLKDTSVVTLDKLGTAATILTGAIGSLFGVSIFPSHALDNRQDNVSSTGENTLAGPNTLSTDVLFNRRRWLIGDRRQTTFEQDKNIETNLISMVTALRLSLNTVEATPTNATDTPIVVSIVNVD
ncbi:MAG: hypothetical protein ACE5FA_00045 [Dehalococcoidia bacterium]